MKTLFDKLDTESNIEYIYRMCTRRELYNLTWQELSEILNSQLGCNKSESYYRKGYKNGKFYELYEEPSDASSLKSLDTPAQNPQPSELSDEQELLFKILKERVKVRDERTQFNAEVRRVARYEDLLDLSKEIAHTVADVFKEKMPLHILPERGNYISGTKAAILELSDWHYGIEVNSYWNVYNTEIAKQRVKKLLDDTILRCQENGVNEIWVVNLADLICGRIHLTLRLQSRIDVITQIIEVSEILAEFLTCLRNTGMKVHYVGCLDNHSRLEPNKSDSLDLESLARITDWYLKERLDGDVLFHDNEFSSDIINFEVMGYRIAGIHGDKDKPADVVKHLTLMTRQQYDLVLTAHLHHFSCDEQNETVVISNGSLMGTDSYAEKLRLSSVPSQNLIIVSEKSVCDAVYRITLD